MVTNKRTHTILCILSLAIFLSTFVAVHTDLDGRYNPTCPACQLEHNAGCISLSFSLEGVLPQLEQQLDFIEFSAPKPTKQYSINYQGTRSPPANQI
jgi:hypothetical protein